MVACIRSAFLARKLLQHDRAVDAPGARYPHEEAVDKKAEEFVEVAGVEPCWRTCFQ